MARDPLNKDWLKKWLKGEPHIILGEEDNPYLRRWYIIPRNKFLNVYLHHFLRSDDDRALHDHPWWWLSFILRGGYWEHLQNRPLTIRSWRAPGSIAMRLPRTPHRVELDHDGDKEKSAWTIFVTGPRVREWGFHCPKGWVHWKDFTTGFGGSRVGKGCGEFE